MELVVPAEARGRSLKRWLIEQFPSLSQLYLSKVVRDGGLTVDGVTRTWGRKLYGGERIELAVDPAALTSRRGEAMPLDILHEDSGMLVLNKPAGLLVHPTMVIKQGTLSNGIAHYLGEDRFWFVHRLDRETSGILVVAKTRDALQTLEREWRSGAVSKSYIALLEGQLTKDCEITAPIARVEDRQPAWGVTMGGKESLSRLWVLSQQGLRTLVRLEPVTGRTNQLRIHCASIGHPVVGDPLYGLGPAERLYLHAERVEVLGHTFVAPTPWEAAAS